MNRHEREVYDGLLDAGAVAGEACPVCGRDDVGGSGPCSEACELEMERRERRAELLERYRDDVPDRDYGDEAVEREPAWMGGGAE